jgi:hypothetical protein
VGAPLSSPPKFDGSDVWSPTTDSAPGGSALAQWSDGYVVGNDLFVTDELAVPFDLAIGNGGRRRTSFQLRVLEIHLPSSAQDSVTGVLAGNIRVGDFGALIPDCGGFPNPQQFADILATDTSSPQTACDAVSFGIGFVAKPIKIGSPAAGLPDPAGCQ